MAIVRGLLCAFALFAAAFALHIVGGATDQRWLFAVAVALIFATAVSFPVLAWLAGGRPAGSQRTAMLALGTVVGTVLTAAALWAADDRSTAWWHVPASLAAVVAMEAALLGVARTHPKAALW